MNLVRKLVDRRLAFFQVYAFDGAVFFARLAKRLNTQLGAHERKNTTDLFYGRRRADADVGDELVIVAFDWPRAACS